MLSIFSCVCWPSVCLLWRNVCLGLLPIFCLGCLVFDIELHERLVYFGDYSFVGCFLCKYFLPFWGLSFCFTVSFAVQPCFILNIAVQWPFKNANQIMVTSFLNSLRGFALLLKDNPNFLPSPTRSYMIWPLPMPLTLCSTIFSSFFTPYTLAFSCSLNMPGFSPSSGLYTCCFLPWDILSHHRTLSGHSGLSSKITFSVRPFLTFLSK